MPTEGNEAGQEGRSKALSMSTSGRKRERRSQVHAPTSPSVLQKTQPNGVVETKPSQLLRNRDGKREREAGGFSLTEENPLAKDSRLGFAPASSCFSFAVELSTSHTRRLPDMCTE